VNCSCNIHKEGYRGQVISLVEFDLTRPSLCFEDCPLEKVIGLNY